MSVRLMRAAWPCLIVTLVTIGGCAGGPGWRPDPARPPFRAVEWDGGTAILPRPGQAIALAGCGNETLGVPVLLADWPTSRDGRPVGRLSIVSNVDTGDVRFYELLPLPADLNRASYVRSTGEWPASRSLPRVMLPLAGDLANLRDPARPADPAPPARPVPILLWIAWTLPAHLPAAPVQFDVQVSDAAGHTLAHLPGTLATRPFALPATTALPIIGRLSWEGLTATFPQAFADLRDDGLDRSTDNSAAAVQALDQLQALARAFRVQVIAPDLRPRVKWPSAGQAPEVDWSSFDSLVSPWLARGVFWAVPAARDADRYDARSRRDYWSLAASHFAAHGWLDHSAAMIERPLTPPVNAHGEETSAGDSKQDLLLSAVAAELLASNPQLPVAVPLSAGQVQFAAPGDASGMVPRDAAGRLRLAAPGLIGSTETSSRPNEGAPPATWLRLDEAPGSRPETSAASASAVRATAWLAWRRDAWAIFVGDVLPPAGDDIATPIDPQRSTWFYPGAAFNVPGVLPTVQLAWAERAEQDAEYLALAAARDHTHAARRVADAIVRPVRLSPAALNDPSNALLAGTADANAWQTALALVGDAATADGPAARAAWVARFDHFADTQAAPSLIARTTNWFWDLPTPRKQPAGGAMPRIDTSDFGPTADAPRDWVGLQLGIDCFQPGPPAPAGASLRWVRVPPGWHVREGSSPVPLGGNGSIGRAELDARINLPELGDAALRTPAAARQTAVVALVNEFSHAEQQLELNVPVAICDHRDGPEPTIDGSLDDWRNDQAIQSGPLLQMLSRPAVQKHATEPTRADADVLTTWSNAGLYVAFRLPRTDRPGQGRNALAARNYLEYQDRRAWGEDLCEFIAQPLYEAAGRAAAGPVLHIVCKPLGQNWVERKRDRRLYVDPWAPVEGAAVRYASTLDAAGVWRGELLIPWDILDDAGRGRPALLRFNFSRHIGLTGESGSWAGPMDFGRDDALNGLLYLRDDPVPGSR